MTEELRGFEDTKYVPKKLSEQITLCPVCGAQSKLEVYQYEIPVEGTILIIVMNCSSCGYKYREVLPLKYAGKPVLIKINLVEKNDLNTVIYRSPYAFIFIPELKVEIKPGPANPGEITTIDGLLLNVAEHLYALCDDMENPPQCYDVVSKLVSAANGDLRISIEIYDPQGLSTVVKSYTSNYEVQIGVQKEVEEGFMEIKGV